MKAVCWMLPFLFQRHWHCLISNVWQWWWPPHKVSLVSRRSVLNDVVFLQIPSKSNEHSMWSIWIDFCSLASLYLQYSLENLHYVCKILGVQSQTCYFCMDQNCWYSKSANCSRLGCFKCIFFAFDVRMLICVYITNKTHNVTLCFCQRNSQIKLAPCPYQLRYINATLLRDAHQLDYFKNNFYWNFVLFVFICKNWFYINGWNIKDVWSDMRALIFPAYTNIRF